jgi:hypothetical protein
MGLIWKVIITRIVVAAALALVPVGFAQAQDWPSQPITLVVPFGARGGTDVVARMIAPRMGEVLGQQIVIENVGGAGGMNGASRVARAALLTFTVARSWHRPRIAWVRTIPQSSRSAWRCGEMLDLVEEALDQITLPVDVVVIGDGLRSRADRCQSASKFDPRGSPASAVAERLRKGDCVQC